MKNPILKIALPSILTNITVPLLSLIDTAITGHLGSPIYIGAISVGGALFSMIFWIFGFLRAGTGGLTAQAVGRKDDDECRFILQRSLMVAGLIALTIIILQQPFSKLAFQFIDTTPQIASCAMTYFKILVWGAPAVMCLYSLNGWFIGMQNARFPLYVALVQNIGNIILSLVFVIVFGMKIEGVALGTLLAQYSGLITAFALAMRLSGKKIFNFNRQLMKDFGVFFRVNRDIFLRTLCLVAVTVYFTKAGAHQGETILAVNAILIQLFMLFSYFIDGFAYAGEAIGGKCKGARDMTNFKKMLHDVFLWGTAFAVIFTFIYGFGGMKLIGILTNEQSVIEMAPRYLPYVVAVPLLGFAAFLFDGIMVGITATKDMLISMLVATAAFFVIWFVFNDKYGNDALWCAFLTYLLLRGFVQALCLKCTMKSA